jgi:hypothetical protein
MSALASQIRPLRIVHSILLVSVGLYAFLGEIQSQKGYELNPVLEIGFAVCAAWTVAVAIFLRRSMVAGALEVFRSDPENSRALQRWRLGQIISMVLAESVALCGFALRFVGVPVVRVIPYYLASVLLFLWFRPSEPAS